MIDETLFDAEEKMEKAVSVARDDLSSIRTGRANPGMFSRLTIDYYGSATPITQLSSINVPEARLVVIKPYEQSQLKPIEDAIRNSDLGVNPTNDGTLIRVSIPQLTEERRRELVKQAKAKGEDARVSVRNIRRKAMEELHRIRKDGEAGEDEVEPCREGPRQNHSPVHQPDRRAGQAQRRRTAGGLVADQRASHVAETDAGPAEPAKKQSRAGRNLPAAIAVGSVLGFSVIAILVFAPYVWIGVVAVAMIDRDPRGGAAAARGGVRDPDRAAADRRPGDDLVDVAVRPGRRLGAFAGTVVVCMIWRLLGGAEPRPGELFARRLSDGVPSHLDSVVRELRRAVGLSRRRRAAGAVSDARRGLLRYRRVHRGRAVRQAPNGSGHQPEEVLGGPGRVAACWASPHRCWP